MTDCFLSYIPLLLRSSIASILNSWQFVAITMWKWCALLRQRMQREFMKEYGSLCRSILKDMMIYAGKDYQ